MLRSGLKVCQELLHSLNEGAINELKMAPAMGAKRIQQILDLRRSGRLTLERLLKVKGISSKTLGRLATLGHDVIKMNDVITIIETSQYYHSLYGHIVPEVASSVLSIDLGLSHVAIAHLGMDMRLLEWERVSLQFPRPYNPMSCYEMVSGLVARLPSASVCLIEAQSHRTVAKSHAGFMDVSLRLRLLESILFAVALERGLTVVTISPARVGRYFDLTSGHYRNKKKAASDLVSSLVGIEGSDKLTTPLGDELSIDASLREYFSSENKVDDLSDSLLQAIAFIEWYKLYKILWL